MRSLTQTRPVSGGARAEAARPKLSRETLRAVRPLTALKPVRIVSAVAFDWAVIVCVIALSIHFLSGWLLILLPASWFLIASRQHALLVLMHDASHGLLFRNRGLNDLASDLFCAYPFGASTAVYRESHLRHHRFLNTEGDPDWLRKQVEPGAGRKWKFPQPRPKVLTMLLFFVAGYGLFDIAFQLRWQRLQRKTANAATGKAGAKPLLRLAYYFVLAGLLYATGGWGAFAVYWLVPMFTFLPALLYLRNLSEHFGLPADRPEVLTRNTLSSPLGRALLAPHHIGYHIDHHSAAYVPFYNLKKLHAILSSDSSYRGVFYRKDSYLWGGSTVIGDLTAAGTVPLQRLILGEEGR